MHYLGCVLHALAFIVRFQGVDSVTCRDSTRKVALVAGPRANSPFATGWPETQEYLFELIDAAPGQRKGYPMFRSLIRLALAFTTFALVIPNTFAHDSWISRGGHRNRAGEWCCGDGDCFVIPKERIMMTGEGYVIIQGPLAGVGPQQYESVPFSEASLPPTESSGAANVRTERAAASLRRRRPPERIRDRSHKASRSRKPGDLDASRRCRGTAARRRA
jgi:hypothetical protein